MKAPIRIGLPPNLRILYIERWEEGYWRIPIHVDKTGQLGTFIHLYNNGKIERVTIRDDQGDEVVLIKPKDG